MWASVCYMRWGCIPIGVGLAVFLLGGGLNCRSTNSYLLLPPLSFVLFCLINECNDADDGDGDDDE